MHFSQCKNWAKYIFVFQGFSWCTNEYMSEMFCSAEKQKRDAKQQASPL